MIILIISRRRSRHHLLRHIIIIPRSPITETLERERTRWLAYLTLIATLITLPMALYQALSDRKLGLASYNSAWIMMCGTIIMSVRLVYSHSTHWYMPAVLKYVVRILWMVPLYALHCNPVWFCATIGLAFILIPCRILWSLRHRLLCVLLDGIVGWTRRLGGTDPSQGSGDWASVSFYKTVGIGIGIHACLLILCVKGPACTKKVKFDQRVEFPYSCFLIQNWSVMFAKAWQGFFCSSKTYANEQWTFWSCYWQLIPNRPDISDELFKVEHGRAIRTHPGRRRVNVTRWERRGRQYTTKCIT